MEPVYNPTSGPYLNRPVYSHTSGPPVTGFSTPRRLFNPLFKNFPISSRSLRSEKGSLILISFLDSKFAIPIHAILSLSIYLYVSQLPSQRMTRSWSPSVQNRICCSGTFFYDYKSMNFFSSYLYVFPVLRFVGFWYGVGLCIWFFIFWVLGWLFGFYCLPRCGGCLFVWYLRPVVFNDLQLFCAYFLCFCIKVLSVERYISNRTSKNWEPWEKIYQKDAYITQKEWSLWSWEICLLSD